MNGFRDLYVLKRRFAVDREAINFDWESKRDVSRARGGRRPRECLGRHVWRANRVDSWGWRGRGLSRPSAGLWRRDRRVLRYVVPVREVPRRGFDATDGTVPVIFDASGDSALAVDLPSQDAQHANWSPSSDKLAYTVADSSTSLGGRTTVRILEPGGSDDAWPGSVQVSGAITGLVWSPVMAINSLLRRPARRPCCPQG